MKIATWNVNSLRVRLPQVLEWLKAVNPEILMLQEIKMPQENFPSEAFAEAGYTAIASGQKTYNGVATLIKNGIKNSLQYIAESADIQTDFPLADHTGAPLEAQYLVQRRFLAVTIGDMRVLNIYVPNGESLESQKYIYKLHWLRGLRDYLQAELKRYPKLIVAGDFNIAPADEDVRNPEAWQTSVLTSAAERGFFEELLAFGLKDSFRLFPQPEKSYTWWDYRALAFRRNLGLRIDHVLLSAPLAALCTSCQIDRAPRGWPQPSDHAPVIADLQI